MRMMRVRQLQGDVNEREEAELRLKSGSGQHTQRKRYKILTV